MPTEAQILTLAQWLSPLYPVGAYAYSHGLEWAVEAGEVTDRATLGVWVEEVLLHGSGRSDALFLAASFHAAGAEALTGIDATCRAFAASKERLQETELQGAAFCDVTRTVWGHDIRDLAYPVAFGRAVRLSALPLDLAAQMYLQAFLANLVSAGMRLIPLGQTAGQALIRALAPLCAEIAGGVRDGDLESLSGTAFLADIASMRHETQYSRTFRT